MQAIYGPNYLHIHRHAGLEFHGKLIFKDSDLFNQPPDELLVVFGNGGGLFLKECAHICDTLFEFIAVGVFNLSLLLLFTETVDFFGYILVVGLGAGQL